MDFSNFFFQTSGNNPIPFPVGNSLRFRGAQYLQRTFTATPTTWTLSLWVKPAVQGATTERLVGVRQAGSVSNSLDFTSNKYLRVYSNTTGLDVTTNRIYRDPAAWYHIVVNSTPSNCFFWTNGVLTGSDSQFQLFNSGATNSIGRDGDAAGNYLNGYLSEIHYVEGNALDPATFGEFNADGVWVPREVEGVTYGAEGFYLDFSDPDDIGADRSGNGNDWTPTGFELADVTSVQFDWMVDSPTNNYSTYNPVDKNGGDTFMASLEYTGPYSSVTAQNAHGCRGTIGVQPSGKFYFEAQGRVLSGGGNSCLLGLTSYEGSISYAVFAQQVSPWIGVDASHYNGSIVFQSYGANASLANGTTLWASYNQNDIVGFAFDFDAGKLWISKNGTWSSGGTPDSGTGETTTFDPGTNPWRFWGEYVASNDNNNRSSALVNFGQRPFKYPPGFSNPTTAFNTVLWTGDDNNPRQIPGVGFQPDLVWIKCRSEGFNHVLCDSVRGTAQDTALASNSTNPESSNTNGYVSAYGADGFTVDAGSSSTSPFVCTNANNRTYVAWCFNAGDGAPVTNTDGTITSTVKASPENGFSIATFTMGSGTFTVGHGLTKAPQLLITKSTSDTSSWWVYSEELGTGAYLALNSTADAATDYSWGSAPTSSVFTANNNFFTNGYDYVAYCFADTDGKVKTGSYTGNGSSSGPYVTTGFRPAMVLLKRTDAAGNWQMYDSVREPTNPKYKELVPNSALEENSISLNIATAINFFNDGFSLSDPDTSSNANGGRYLYIAFAENFTPDDLKDLTAKNLEPVDITDPSQHFQTVLDTGANILTAAQTAFPNGLWWIKDRANSNQHQLVDSTRGGDVITCPQLATPLPYVAPAGNSVAWCWSAPTSYTNATSNTTGRINVDAGFAILNANISAGTFTVPHGLNEAPEFLIAVGTSNSTTQRNVWHTGIAASEGLYLNGNNGKFSAPNLWASTAPTSTEITLGSDWGTTGATTMAIYAWHSVPGYSAFGSYQGNGNDDGPFIYTGFRPAFLLLKAIDVTVDWVMFDSSRDTYNVVQTALNPSYGTGEVQSASYYNDFLSNGFKIRTSHNIMGASGKNYIYAAFAEHPFGGGNVSPSPAR